MSSSKLQESSEVRIGHSLNTHEEEFVKRRIKTVQQSLEKFGIHCPLNKVPKIALLGSGGGERAMLGLLGSLVKLEKAGLLDCILYLSGVSGSTWCMTSLYQDSDWSSHLDSVKQKIIQTLSGPGVSWSDAISKLRKYKNEKDNFNLTSFWAVIIVTSYVKEINEHKMSEQRGHDKDPFPIYTVIDKGFKHQKNYRDTWFEINPVEAGYSLTGAFVDVSKFCSKFDDGCKIKDQPEMDMLYLQAVCGSCIADGIFNREYIWKKIEEFIHHIFDKNEKIFEEMPNEANMTLSIEEVHQLFIDLVEMNLSALKDEDTSAKEKAIIAKLSKLDGDECKLVFRMDKTEENYMKDFTVAVCEHLKLSLNFWPFDLISCICASVWAWGREYNFVYKMKDERVPTILQESKTRDYIDAGLLLNSPYMSVLRQEREIDLIISLDFSEDPFETVKTAAKTCMELNIPFPEVNIPSVKYPEDFYVFKGHGKAPTVIHIPLFNTVNCGDEIEWWRKTYRTIQLPYSPDQIDPLVDVAGKNITNNREKLLREIKKCIGRKSAEH